VGYPGGVLARAEDLRSGRTPFVLATVVRAMRPTSAKAGDRALILPDGTIEGFVGGECAEASVRRYGLQVLASRDPLVLRIVPGEEADAGPGTMIGETFAAHGVTNHSDHERLAGGVPGVAAAGPAGGVPGVAAGGAPEEPAASGAGRSAGGAAGQPGGSAGTGLVTVANPCASGGMLEIFLEGVFPPPLVLVHGDGPIACAVREVGRALGYDLRIADLGAGAAAAGTGAAGTGAAGSPARQPQVPPGTDAVIVASHGRDEAPILAAALAAAVPYVGLVASRKRGAQVLAGLDVPAEAAARIRTPAGLDIGARTVQEVALSIFAEIVAERPVPPARGPAGEAAAPGEAALASGAGAWVETDPVCGMQVAVAAATISLYHGGRTWHFCGSGCRDAFAADPSRFAAPGSAEGDPAAASGTA
jgi:xanthine dehydrogenase accessory factor